jgi:dihydroorotate dehydrogenase electron transfer subunit
LTAEARKKHTLQILIDAGKPGKMMLATVSGVASTKPALVNFFDKKVPAIDLITTKSFQVGSNAGNREPIITEPEIGSFGNSVGLKNPGMVQAVSDMKSLRGKGINKLLNISVSASTPEDFITLVKAFEPYADIIELNFSCPHASAGYGASIGCDPGVAAEYMRAVRTAVGTACSALIFPKLTPNVADIGVIAKAVAAAGADGISAINTTGPEIYREPHSGEIILNNPIGGKGGQSGNWVRERALACMKSIRDAVGSELPIIGMGGVSTGHDAAAMKRAGANVVGIGSAFGRVHQKDWSAYVETVKNSAETILMGNDFGEAEINYLTNTPSMKYQPFTITKKVEHTEDITIFYLDGSMKCGPGEYAFIWIPGVGEKPFSIAEQDPLTFIVKRRGHFTQELLSRSVGGVLYVRGIYGAEVTLPGKRRAVLAAGGTGIAVLPSLADRLRQEKIGMDIYYGTSSDDERQPLLKDKLSRYGSFTAIPDAGTPGRVLDVLAKNETDLSDSACFFVGPEPFMNKAAKIAIEKGADKRAVMLSMERPSLCGIGMCGECACGDRLTCRYGTFVSYEFLENNAPELLK